MQVFSRIFPSKIQLIYNAFSLLQLYLRAFVGDHPRGWTRPYACMVAYVRADGRRQTAQNTNITGKTHYNSFRLKYPVYSLYLT